jgi:aspartate aminotransferase-like enzyme
MIKKYLLAPGPTPVPESVLLAMAQPIFHHRTPQFEALFADTAASLQALFKTKQDVVMLASSGTGAMEAAVTNTTSPGDRVLVVNGGKFGERWGKIAAGYGLAVTELKVEWGTAVDPAAIAKALKDHPETKLVLMQGSETSTTVLHPVAEVAKITRETDTLLVVDGITAVGVLDLPMDALGIDVLLTGSQKALMLPPGLAFVALSERAWKAAAAATCPRFYFDLKRERDNQQKHTTAWTPAISLIFGLHEALRLMFAEGLDHVYARHDRLARATRAGAEALGLKLVAPTAPSPATTGIYLPEGVPGKLVGYLRDRVGITFAGGQDQLKGKICRVAHLGYIGSFDIVTALAALEMGIAAFGKPVDFGRGVGAAQRILMDGMPAAPSA